MEIDNKYNEKSDLFLSKLINEEKKERIDEEETDSQSCSITIFYPDKIPKNKKKIIYTGQLLNSDDLFVDTKIGRDCIDSDEVSENSEIPIQILRIVKRISKIMKMNYGHFLSMKMEGLILQYLDL